MASAFNLTLHDRIPAGHQVERVFTDEKLRNLARVNRVSTFYGVYYPRSKLRGRSRQAIFPRKMRHFPQWVEPLEVVNEGYLVSGFVVMGLASVFALARTDSAM
jgi:hypothetical protein